MDSDMSGDEKMIVSESQILAMPVRHFRDRLGNAPCGTRRTRGVTSTRKEDRVTCPNCLGRLRDAAGKVMNAAENRGSRDLVLLAQVSRAEAEAEFLRAAMREAWTVLDGPGEQGAKINAARELLRRVPGAVPSMM